MSTGDSALQDYLREAQFVVRSEPNSFDGRGENRRYTRRDATDLEQVHIQRSPRATVEVWQIAATVTYLEERLRRYNRRTIF